MSIGIERKNLSTAEEHKEGGPSKQQKEGRGQRKTPANVLRSRRECVADETEEQKGGRGKADEIEENEKKSRTNKSMQRSRRVETSNKGRGDE